MVIIKAKRIIAGAIVISQILCCTNFAFADETNILSDLEIKEEISTEDVTSYDIEDINANDSSTEYFDADTEELEIDDIKVETNGGIISIVKGNDDSDLLSGKSTYASRAALPESYNSVDIKDSEEVKKLTYVSPVKNQSSLGTCWDFSATACMESLLMKKDDVKNADDEKYDPEKYDFSELHAAYALSSTCLKDGQYGFTRNYSDGGNFSYYYSYLTRESDLSYGTTNADDAGKNLYNGNIKESDLPYKNNYTKNFTDPDIYSKMGSDALDNFPREFIRLDLRQKLNDEQIENRNRIIKEKVIENGAVGIIINSGSSSQSASKGFLTATNGDMLLYYNVPNSSNHEVVVVGYDDNYPASNFSGFSAILTESDEYYPTTPRHDGAFIVKNSWGEGWGNNGYFYMSYDSAIHYVEFFASIDTRDFCDNVYDYTPYMCSSALSSIDYSGDSSKTFKYGRAAANLFTAKTAESKDISERITNVSTYAYNGDVYVRFFADNSVFDGGAFNDLQYIDIKPLNSDTEIVEIDGNKYMYLANQGAYTFELVTPVEIKDSQFVIAAEYYSNSDLDRSKYIVPIEMTYDNLNRKKITGVSFTANDISRFNINNPSDYNFIIKAYTEEYEDPDKKIPGTNIKIDGKDLLIPKGSTIAETYSDIGLTSDSELFILTGDDDHTYKKFKKFDVNTIFNDKTYEGTELYTSNYLEVPEIICNKFQTRTLGSMLCGRIIGEIDPDNISQNIVRVNSLGFKYTISNKENAITNLYGSLNNYTKADENNYAFFYNMGTSSGLSDLRYYALYYKPFIEYTLKDGRTIKIIYGE